MSSQMEVKHEETRIGLMILRNAGTALGCLLLLPAVDGQTAFAIWIIIMSLKESL